MPPRSACIRRGSGKPAGSRTGTRSSRTSSIRHCRWHRTRWVGCGSCPCTYAMRWRCRHRRTPCWATRGRAVADVRRAGTGDGPFRPGDTRGGRGVRLWLGVSKPEWSKDSEEPQRRRPATPSAEQIGETSHRETTDVASTLPRTTSERAAARRRALDSPRGVCYIICPPTRGEAGRSEEGALLRPMPRVPNESPNEAIADGRATTSLSRRWTGRHLL